MNRPPLTRDELIAIRDGNLRNADIRTLLRDIRRLRAVASYARQYVQCVDQHAQNTDVVRIALLNLLGDEACIKEMDALKEEFNRSEK